MQSIKANLVVSNGYSNSVRFIPGHHNLQRQLLKGDTVLLSDCGRIILPHAMCCRLRDGDWSVCCCVYGVEVSDIHLCFSTFHSAPPPSSNINYEMLWKRRATKIDNL